MARFQVRLVVAVLALGSVWSSAAPLEAASSAGSASSNVAMATDWQIFSLDSLWQALFGRRAINPQPLPPGRGRSINPQPLPPG